MFASILLAVAIALVAGAAQAHVVLENRQAPAGTYYVARFEVPHGCAGASTQAIRVQIPEGVTDVKPQPKPGWKVKVVKTHLDKPITDTHGHQVTDLVSEVDWSGGNLPDAYFDEFVMLTHLPNEPGKTVYFPVVQECQGGKMNRWIEIPAAGKSAADYREPAPGVELLPKAAP
jgi:uncharacterized protein YcnI